MHPGLSQQRFRGDVGQGLSGGEKEYSGNQRYVGPGNDLREGEGEKERYRGKER
jgi:hypothetical protein